MPGSFARSPFAGLCAAFVACLILLDIIQGDLAPVFDHEALFLIFSHFPPFLASSKLHYLNHVDVFQGEKLFDHVLGNQRVCAEEDDILASFQHLSHVHP